MKLDNPLLVRWEYASEERLAMRNEDDVVLGAHVCAVDTSPRMVELAQARGLDAQVAEAVAECARVLCPNGSLVASSVCNDNTEVWHLVGVTEPRAPLSNTRENGEAVLRPYFERVERRDLVGELVFPDTESLRTRHVVFVATGPR